MSYKPQSVIQLGERLMSYKPLNVTTPESNPYDKSKPVDNPSAEETTAFPTNELRDRKLRSSAETSSKEEAKMNAQALEIAESMAANVGNVDKIRDILFGGQMRDYEKRFKRLEERFTQENMLFREDMLQRIKVVEERVEGDIDNLVEKAKVDRQERVLAQQDLQREMVNLKNELNNRLSQLDEQISKEIKNLRQQTLTKFQEVALQVRQQNDTLTALLNQEVSQLEEDKVNRTDLAAFFNELAVRLTRSEGTKKGLE